MWEKQSNAANNEGAICQVKRQRQGGLTLDTTEPRFSHNTQMKHINTCVLRQKIKHNR